MDLHLAAYFVAVVDHGGITKAANALYISQPSLSQAIRTLERRLGTTLFDRSGRQLELTEDGRRLDVAARQILADVERAKERVAAVRELDAGRVDLVTSSPFSIDPMVSMVRVFRDRFPRVMVRIHDTPGARGVLDALRRGSAEIGIVDLATTDTGSMRTVPLLTQDLVLALPPELAAGVPDPVTREQVRALPLILDVSGRGGTDPVVDALGEGAVADDPEDTDGPTVVVDCAHPAATWELVARGAGCALVPRSVAEQHIPGAALRSVHPPLTRRVGLVLRSGPVSPAAEAFVAAAVDATGTAGHGIEAV
ncbi:LysR family transcriptional regulator [Rhodococcus gannanensis]|uniref:LysR family transcriptional regulator n=1 Tax=Rhodococcus gannanensis TaxID=1960308 RepID=A0ABW4NZH5_9NOCA